MINFLTSSDARIGTSPTRNAECYASGVPVVCSAGIGDVDRDIKIINGGITINSFDEESLLEVVDNFDEIFKKGGMELRQASERVFSLSVAEKRYKNVYSSILKSI
jgi:predicted glycosyltransferase